MSKRGNNNKNALTSPLIPGPPGSSWVLCTAQLATTIHFFVSCFFVNNNPCRLVVPLNTRAATVSGAAVVDTWVAAIKTPLVT